MQKEAEERRKRREERRKAERSDLPTEELSDLPTEELSDLPGEKRGECPGDGAERKGETEVEIGEKGKEKSAEQTEEETRHAALYYWPIVPQERCKRWVVENATM